MTGMLRTVLIGGLAVAEGLFLIAALIFLLCYWATCEAREGLDKEMQ